MKILNTLDVFSKSSSLLDVGAGYGLFSSLAFDMGYKVTSLEPYLKMEKVRENLNIQKIESTLEDYTNSKPNNRYGIVALLDVLEHTNDLNKTIDDVSNLLDKKGVLIIQVPNYRSMIARLSKNWAWWMVRDHNYHFSSKSIKKLLELHKFKILHMTSYEGLYEMKKNLDGNFTDISNKYLRKLIKAIKFMIFFPGYLVVRYLIWKIFFGGGLILVIAQKKK
ncbi:MAG: class I SAM-dependent methyltransferase [Candidatus Roizmanbacteria bacterium]